MVVMMMVLMIILTMVIMMINNNLENCNKIEKKDFLKHTVTLAHALVTHVSSSVNETCVMHTP
jgi:hypothetical protein